MSNFYRFPMWRVANLALVIVVLSLSSTNLSNADSKEVVLLTVTGNIGVSAKAQFTREDLLALPQVTHRTETKWTDGMIDFSGPLLRDVLSAVDARGDSLRARAINDYAVDIPVSDAKNYDVIIAMTRDGSPMRVRDKGPMWIIYPWSTNRQLLDERIFARSIWQLKSIHVE